MKAGGEEKNVIASNPKEKQSQNGVRVYSPESESKIRIRSNTLLARTLIKCFIIWTFYLRITLSIITQINNDISNLLA